MSINSFTYNGVSSSSFTGVYVGGQATFGAPQRDVTKVAIPGRNGELIRDNGRFLNTQIAYTIVIMNDFVNTARQIKDWLMSVRGYARLEDTYQPNHYRMARVADVIEFETGAYNATGKAQVIFDCKPQRFLKSGETEQTFSSSGTITNPTPFDAKPLIRLSGNGTLSVQIGNMTITATNVSFYVDIDCESMNCYKGDVNKNSSVTFSTHAFPVLPSGDTGIVPGSGTTVAITGRWWEL